MYFLSLFTIPKAVAARLESIQRNILWGSSEGSFKYPLVAWKKVCLPVEMGGLGIRSVVSFNQALLGKWLWRYGHEVTNLWRRVISTKYGEGQEGWSTKVCRRTHGCGLWRSINEGWESFSKHLSFVVGECTRIRFWQDRWIGDNTLKDLYPELYVCSVIKDAYISEVLWIPEGGTGDSNSLFPWKGIWKPKIPKRVVVLLWIAAHGQILTLDNLMLKGLPLANWCCFWFSLGYAKFGGRFDILLASVAWKA
ncbi:putative mitochondrial protein AtMg00310 [Castanea sativa]|uniref:putative mitochondrial protein AtMg00310 n=1 Tax=Castanea sativa TaxID=21020 RepID=UPI003F64A9B3